MELKHFEFSPVMDQASIYYTCLIPFISESPLRISINLEHFYLLIYYTDHSSGRHCFLPSVAIYSYAILFLDLLIICLLRCELSNFFYFIFQLDSNLDRQYLYYSVNHWLKNHKKLSSWNLHFHIIIHPAHWPSHLLPFHYGGSIIFSIYSNLPVQCYSSYYFRVAALSFTH